MFTENITTETQDAADIVLLIDDSGSMQLEHEWLLAMVPYLEAALIKAGVGDYGNRNRYCAIAFGGIGPLEPAHFLLVNGEKCFTADQFPKARIQLKNVGLNEDGYEAIHFAINNVPFRDSPFIAKNVFLISDEGRTIIPQGQSLTKSSVRDELLNNDALLNVIVSVSYLDTSNRAEVVLGQDGNGVTYLLRPNGQYTSNTDGLVITEVRKREREGEEGGGRRGRMEEREERGEGGGGEEMRGKREKRGEGERGKWEEVGNVRMCLPLNSNHTECTCMNTWLHTCTTTQTMPVFQPVHSLYSLFFHSLTKTQSMHTLIWLWA